MALKRKEQLEKQLEELDGTLSAIEVQRDTLENAGLNSEVQKILAYAAKINEEILPTDKEEVQPTDKILPTDKEEELRGLEAWANSPPVIKRSEIDPTRVITDECWAVSLVRLPDCPNPQHAFLVLEGKEGGKSKIWFADFVAVHWFDVLRPGTEGKVRMDYRDSEGVEGPTELLFTCQKKMMNVRASDRLLFSTWLIIKSTAKKLVHMIEDKQGNPPKYHMLGHNSLLAGSSATSSSNSTGHNCFTFAKMMLRDLNDVFISLPEDRLETWIGSATSRYLVDKQFTNRKWYETSSFLLMFGFLAGVLIAFFLPRAF